MRCILMIRKVAPAVLRIDQHRLRKPESLPFTVLRRELVEPVLDPEPKRR